ncbi:hypothetical protein BKH42_04165 [Helicobacter sp. 13S00482-2]|uniref:hypothetical protein n=1 Tax=Helicobacter sp. 13S00482-2 TaxID=1476200 RepID=UPI000BA6187A|nr:hypothetical protein [Helicobacter sp. 13S00482-2]PAF53700.1 hypothetical protein BKH42_04165 [Helicobacter sp. 13S00482-2]
MKKTIFFILLVLIVLLGICYVLIFTQIGNNLLKPLVQSKINQYSPVPLELKTFSLRISELNISAIHKDSLNIKLKAHFSLWHQNFRGDLIAELKNPLTPEAKTFNINSSFEGNIYDFFINTNSDIANSNTSIQTKIKSFKIQELQAKVTGLKLDELLILLKKPPYVSGKLDVNANLKGNWNTSINGQLNAQIQKGLINPELVKNNLHINVPKNDFSLDLKADFKDKIIQDELNFISNFGDIKTKGEVQIPTLQINNQYDISLFNIAPLGILLSKNIRGSFKSKGVLKGDKNNLQMMGYSDIANSNSKYLLSLNQFRLEKFRFDVKKISIEKLFWMFYQPQYLNGTATFMGNMNNSKSLSISGRAKANTNPDIIKKYSQIQVPDAYFIIQTGAMIVDGTGNFDFNIESGLGYFRFKNGNINLKKPYVDGTYDLLVRDLSKLEGFTKKQFNGKLQANGNIKYDKAIDIDFQTTSLGGIAQGRFNPKNFYVNFNEINVKRLLETLQIGTVLNGSASGELNYDLTSEKGKISAFIKDGKIAHTQISDIFKKYSGIDINLQVFEIANFNSNIDKGNLDAELTMQSNQIKISSEYLKINIPKNTIHSKVKFSSSKDYIYVTIDGNLKGPKTQLDANTLIKSEGMKKIQKNIGEILNKIIPPQKEQEAKKLLDKISKKL